MAVCVRAMATQDVAGFDGLYQSILEELYGDNIPALENYRGVYAPERLRFILDDSSGSLFVAEADGSLIGFGAGHASGGVGTIFWLGVIRPARGRGVGSQLLAAVISDFRKKSCHKVALYAHEGRPSLQSFYRRSGFEEIARIKNHYYHMNVVYMTRVLVPNSEPGSES